MAQSFSTPQGTVYRPGVYSTISVQTQNSGIASNGVIVILGEADAGPDYTLESPLSDNGFTPDEGSRVLAKYGSGQLVDAFKEVAQASADPNITGSPLLIYVLKTNSSGRASHTLLNPDSSVYTTLLDKSYGVLGNQLSYTITSPTVEAVPTTGAFTWINNVGTVDTSSVANGGSLQPLSLVANRTPTQFVTAVNGLSGIGASGGVLRTVLPVAGTLTVSVPVGNTFVITYSATWTTTPTVGDTLVIPVTSPIASAAGASVSGGNVGAYVVTAATTATISVTKLSDGGKTGGVPGTITPPVAVGAQAVGASTDIGVYSPVTISLSAAAFIEGVGKSLEIGSLTTGTDLLTRCAYQLNTTPVTWISVAATPYAIASATEQSISLNVTRASTNTSETLVAGGEVALQVGYSGGTAATLTVTGTGITTSVTGGSGTNLTVTFAQFPTLAAIAQYINAQTGYTCQTGTAVLGFLPGTALDQGTFNIQSKLGAQTGRIKDDAYRTYQAILTSQTVSIAAQPTLGIPAAVATSTFLAGGSRGFTTNAIVSAALTACEKLTANFVVPLFSQDATADITAGVTDTSSTYTIASINAATKSHVLSMSTLKRRRNRQAMLSFKGTFANAKTASANIASNRCSMCFQDVKAVNGSGTIVQQQPWMGAVVAAGMQAAGFYRSILNKFANITGAVQAAGDFDDQADGDVEGALIAGLLPLVMAPTGGWIWVSDQTTYGASNNFSYNSIQVTYMSDVTALTVAQETQQAFIGASLADVNAGIILSFFDNIMANLLRLKVIAPSDDAPLGYKNASVIVSGINFTINFEAKVANSLYFGLINVLVSQIQQTATNTQ